MNEIKMKTGRMGVTGRQGRRCKQLLGALKETKGYWTKKEEALDLTLRKPLFGRGSSHVVLQTNE